MAGKQGFASMSPAKRRAIAAKGGRAVPAEKRTFSLDPEKASEAGRKGGGSSKRPPAKKNARRKKR